MSEPTIGQVDARIDTHEQVCTERYGNINDKLVAMDGRLSSQSVQFNERINTLSNRMWAAAFGTLVTATAAVGGLVVLILNLLQRHP